MHDDLAKTSLLRDEGGAGTAWWVLWMIIFLIFGGVAVDSSNAWRMRAELQFTADAAAHAGVIDLIDGGPAARAAAIDYAERNMDTVLHSNVLVESDVVVGSWDGTAFTPFDDGDVFDGAGELVANAVMARTRRDTANSNRLPTYFLRLIGVDSWDVSAVAIAQRYFPDCLQQNSIISGQIIDFQSNNVIHPGICIHAQDHVSVNGGGKPNEEPEGSGNIWMDGVSVTMPSLDDFYDNSGPNPSSDNQEEWMNEKNEGLIPALGEEWLYPKAVDSIGDYLDSHVDADDPAGIWPGYIGEDLAGNPLTDAEGNDLTDPADWIIEIDGADWDIETYEPGYVYDVSCNNPLSLDASAEFPLENVVIIADCKISVGSGGVVKNAVLGTTKSPQNTDTSTIDVGQGSTIGDSVGCSNPGGVVLLSMAGISGPGQTQYKGVKMLATGKVHIAAQADAKVEINVQSAGDIDFASNNEFGAVACVNEEDPYLVWYYRLVF